MSAWAKSKRSGWHLDDAGAAQCDRHIVLYGVATDEPPYHEACPRCYAIDPVYHRRQLGPWEPWK